MLEQSVTEPLAGIACRVSSGTASVLGLRPAALGAAPTTAYLMLGERCTADCAFCAQARTSEAGADQLSRIHWPPYPADEVAEAIGAAHRRGAIGRACLQVTDSAASHDTAQRAVAALSKETGAPICVSIAARDLTEIEALLAAGAQRVSIGLDAATPEVYARTKSGSWEHTWALLIAGARRFPNRLGAHLIAGLGETEEELLITAQALVRLGVVIGLFAFTPVQGARLAGAQPPPLESYRRIQAGLWLLKEGLQVVEQWRFVRGQLVDFGATSDAIAAWLAGGDAFRTAGCTDCNRPFYNERPSGPLYNYPRPLTPIEAAGEIERLLQTLEL